MRLPTFKIVLPDSLRTMLEKRAEKDRLSLGEAIRRRLIRSIEEMDFDIRIRALQATVAEMAVLIEASTGCRIDQHPAAAETLRRAISIWFERGLSEPDAKFEEGDMARGLKLVPGNDPATLAAAIEIIVESNIAVDLVRRSKGEPKGNVIDALEWLETQKRLGEEIQETLGELEGQRDEAAAKSKRRRMRKQERQ